MMNFRAAITELCVKMMVGGGVGGEVVKTALRDLDLNRVKR